MQNVFVILLVEDDAKDAYLAQKAFEHGGMASQVRITRSGSEAVDYLQGNGVYANRCAYPIPGLVVSDLHMPSLDGFGLLKWIRCESEFKCLPVVIMTSSTRYEEINLSYEIGANAYLSKPEDFDKLVYTLEKALKFWSL